MESIFFLDFYVIQKYVHLIRKLSLSSNNIERIANLGSMKHLKILSLGRNSIKSIAGIVIIDWINGKNLEKSRKVQPTNLFL